MDSTPKLRENLEFYVEHQKELVEKYNGKVLLIYEQGVVEAFDSSSDAFYSGVKKFKPGTFSVIRCSPGDDDYTVNYRTVNRFSRMVMT